jgi:hypothetical protein
MVRCVCAAAGNGRQPPPGGPAAEAPRPAAPPAASLLTPDYYSIHCAAGTAGMSWADLAGLLQQEGLMSGEEVAQFVQQHTAADVSSADLASYIPPSRHRHIILSGP